MPSPSTAPAFGDSDIPALMADMGIAISVGGVVGVGLLDEADEITIQDGVRGQVIMTMTTLTVRTSDFPNVAVDAAVEVGTFNFTVRERLRLNDGALTKLLLGSGPIVPSIGPVPNNIIDGGTFADGAAPILDGGGF